MNPRWSITTRGGYTIYKKDGTDRIIVGPEYTMFIRKYGGGVHCVRYRDGRRVYQDGGYREEYVTAYFDTTGPIHRTAEWLTPTGW